MAIVASPGTGSTGCASDEPAASQALVNKLLRSRFPANPERALLADVWLANSRHGDALTLSFELVVCVFRPLKFG
jgi:hypothetical protein